MASHNSLPVPSHHIGYWPTCEEELPMTMQVGMVGTDGIVLASDTKWVEHTLGAARNIYDKTKIKISDERGIAISYARNMETAGPVADSIIAELTDSEMLTPIFPTQNLAQQILDE